MEIRLNNLKLKTVSYKDIAILDRFYNDKDTMALAGFDSALNLSLKQIKELIYQSYSKIRIRLLMFVNEVVIGEMTYHPLENDNYHISLNIYRQDYHNKGYGTNFIRLLINYLFKQKKARLVSLDVKKDNSSAISFYQNIGFKIKNEVNNFYQMETDKNSFYILDKYEYLLFDIDDTLLSFYKAERKALSIALSKVNIKANDKILDQYHQINMKYWEMVEKSIITRKRCLIARFEEFLPLYNISMSAEDFEEIYRYNLNKQHFLVKDARLVLETLVKNYKVYAITNGVYKTQINRIKQAKITHYFTKMFISELIGFNKPSIEFVKFVEANIENFDKSKALIIGDSLTSDIKLGINGNIDTCLFNLNRQTIDDKIKPNYKINYLKELILLSKKD